MSNTIKHVKRICTNKSCKEIQHKHTFNDDMIVTVDWFKSVFTKCPISIDGDIGYVHLICNVCLSIESVMETVKEIIFNVENGINLLPDQN